MDPSTLTNQVMTTLTPVMPYLGTAGAAIATKVGEDVEARLAPANYLGQIGRLV
jgi:hypothetical protein